MANTPGPFQIRRMPQGVLCRPDYVGAKKLTASTASQFTFPTGTRYVVFSGTTDFYAAYGSDPTAAVPSADVTDGTASELNPTERFLQDGDTKVSLITSADGIVTIACFIGG